MFSLSDISCSILKLSPYKSSDFMSLCPPTSGIPSSFGPRALCAAYCICRYTGSIGDFAIQKKQSATAAHSMRSTNVRELTDKSSYSKHLNLKCPALEIFTRKPAERQSPDASSRTRTSAIGTSIDERQVSKLLDAFGY